MGNGAIGENSHRNNSSIFFDCSLPSRLSLPGPYPAQHPGNDEARDDEEDVDADIATAQGGDAAVEKENEQDGDGSKTLHVRPELPVFGSRA